MGEVKELTKKMDRLEEVLIDLAVAQRRSEEEGLRLKQSLKELSEVQKRTEKSLDRLSETQRRTEEALRELKEAQKKTEETLRESEALWNKRWGELARKMGTMAEDILIPGFPKITDALGFEVTEMAARVRIGPRDRWKEYDAVVWAEKDGEEVVFVAEVKSKLRAEDFNDFRSKLEFFAEHAKRAKGRRIIPVMATFNPEPDLVNLATKRKVLLVGMSGAYVEALNPEVVSNGRSGG